MNPVYGYYQWALEAQEWSEVEDTEEAKRAAGALMKRFLHADVRRWLRADIFGEEGTPAKFRSATQSASVWQQVQPR